MDTVPKLLHGGHDSVWKAHLTLIFSKLGKDLDILATHSTLKDIAGLPNNVGSFLYNVLQTWLTLRNETNEEGTDTVFLNSPLWNNPNFQCRHTQLYIEAWRKGGIHKIQDILGDTHELITLQALQAKVGQSACRHIQCNNEQ